MRRSLSIPSPRGSSRRASGGQLSGWVSDGERRERTLRGILNAAEASTTPSLLIGSTLRSAHVDFDRLYLQFAGGRDIYLVISGPFTLIVGDIAVSHEPASDGGLAAAKALAGRIISKAALEADGTLTLDLEGTALRAAAGADYEAWELRGFDGSLFVSLPGGGIAAWDASTVR